jgi:hypothetical protein
LEKSASFDQPLASTVKNLIYSTNIYETTSRELFESIYSLHVEECGMFIHPQHTFLAASPDRLIDQDAILEIKCPYAARNMEVEDAVKKKIIDFCYIENNKVKLKDNHNYMYQIRRLLEITNRECCYFFVYTFKDYNCEIIMRNKQFWKDQMIGKLERFYSSAYLFELLLDSRYNRNMAIRDIKCKDL